MSSPEDYYEKNMVDPPPVDAWVNSTGLTKEYIDHIVSSLMKEDYRSIKDKINITGQYALDKDLKRVYTLYLSYLESR